MVNAAYTAFEIPSLTCDDYLSAALPRLVNFILPLTYFNRKFPIIFSLSQIYENSVLYTTMSFHQYLHSVQVNAGPVT
jgi:hypothetical protein